MKFSIVITLFFLSLISCKQSSDKNKREAQHNLVSTTSDTEFIQSKQNTDTSNQYIYDFMKMVVADQQLDLNYGLTAAPEENCDLSQNDSLLLTSLLKEKTTKPIDDSNPNIISPVSLYELPHCLTKADISYMLMQKKSLSTFSWNISRMGFNSSNNNNWYNISIPLFSKDKNKVVVMIRSLCPGLCGTGWTLVFIKEKNKWTSNTLGSWIH